MKRTLSLILAALLLASSMTACGKTEPKETEKNETQAVETKAPATEKAETDAPDTNPPATDAPETDAPTPAYPYDTSLITENGVAKAHIVLAEGATTDEKKAAEELALHIKLISGADIAVTNGAQSDSLPIIIGTPTTVPELEELFSEDLAWLRDVGKVGEMERYANDGFAIRFHEGKLYIFGAVARGALYGTYDFIEENMDVMWLSSTDAGIIYDEMPTISIIKTDYKEKSPFSIRTQGGSPGFQLRNKCYTIADPVGGEHNVRWLGLTSPTYDPTITEYWETNLEGVHLPPSMDNQVNSATSNQVNFWSQLTADTVGESVIARLDAYSDDTRPLCYSVGEQDWGFSSGVYPEMTEPFEYEPGKFVYPDDPAYESTVYFTFINRVARKVAEKYPDVTIVTLIYGMGAQVPLCDIDDNVAGWFCPLDDDLTVTCLRDGLTMETDGVKTITQKYAENFEKWVDKHPNILVYTYYYVHYAQGYYERPLWYRIRNDFQYFAENGVLGFTICGPGRDGEHWLYDCQRAINEPDAPYPFTWDDAYRMNLLSYWLTYRLEWNPYEDIDALIVKFCDRVYGDASPYMQEYYALLTKGWNEGTEILKTEYNAQITFNRDQQYYFDYFIDITTEDGVYIYEALQNALTKAWEAADDRAKEYIRYPYEMFMDWEKILG